MSDGIYRALRGAVAHERALEVVADNVANTSTPGFRGRKLSFEEVWAQGGEGTGRAVRLDPNAVDPTAGALRPTGRPLDAAIAGPGFFVFQGPAGVRLSRNGAFALSPEGQLIGAGGWPVLGSDGAPILVSGAAGEVRIAQDGTVRSGAVEHGRLWVAEVSPEELVSEGAHLRPEAELEPAARSTVQLSPGTLEAANVNAVQGMLDLIRITRTFESLTRAIEMESELDARTARGG